LGADRVYRIALVDDHPIIRDGLRYHLRQHADFEVCGEAENVSEGITLFRDQRPDLAIVDLRLTDGHGLELVRKANAAKLAVKCLAYSVYAEAIYAERCLRAGAAGFLCKSEPADAVITALRLIANGQIYASAAVTQRLMTPCSQRTEYASPTDPLTDRELEIFELLGKGLTTRGIAVRLHLSSSTVDTHRERIKRKLGLHTSNELIRFSAQWVLEYGEGQA